MSVWSSCQFFPPPAPTAASNGFPGSGTLGTAPNTKPILPCSHTSKEQLFLKNPLQLPAASAQHSCRGFRETGELCPEIVQSQQALGGESGKPQNGERSSQHCRCLSPDHAHEQAGKSLQEGLTVLPAGPLQELVQDAGKGTAHFQRKKVTALSH